MKYFISTKFVREHGDAIALGGQFFNYLTYCGMEHVQFCKYLGYVSLDVYCDTLEEAEEIEKISRDFLMRGWQSDIEDFSDSKPSFWLVRFKYYFA